MTADPLTVVVAPGVLTDDRTAGEVLAAALAARDLAGTLRTTATAEELTAATSEAAPGALLVVAATPEPLAQLLPALPAGAAVRVDLGPGPLDTSPAVTRHVRGRGLAGLRAGVEAWFHDTTAPPAVVAVGAHPDQHLEVRLPAGPGPHPVAVLVHGGYWRSRWACDLMDALAVDLAGRGFAAVNLEYRRPDEHGWAATTADVADGLQALSAAAATGTPLDLDRVALLGHSAGGQLVVRLAADLAGTDAAVRPALTVSLAGVLDLAAADRRWLSEGAVARALGGRADEVPDVYATASPLARVPVRAPLAVVCGRDDDLDLLDASRTFAAAAVAAGDDVVVLEDAGDHFAVIDPASALWARVADLLATRLGAAGPSARAGAAPVP
ncbi:alpha/beta hydrolase fold domain-containing protein [Kineococcus sp. R8]|uniref:alpha/beta hydrolase n=1 Tax=Kineococcus siccus TaxID=2696567 RepID=UPI0014122583|nr:alpha/beta hydrolase [Kineococcus siccus]NAZ80520.1 alpha/beta hydrolase fold domain-containing protein [Kineococcus siccus]